MSVLSLRAFTAASVLAAAALAASPQVKLTIDAADRGPRIGDLHYGIFYEEINNAGDGGIYAELIRNRSFEDGSLEYWSRKGDCTMAKLTDGLMNQAQGAALRLDLKSAGAGIYNTGYWGINCVEGDTYTLSFWIAAPDGGWNGQATAVLADAQGNIGASVVVEAIKATDKWQKVMATMTATKTIADARFELTFGKAGTVYLDMVSLFPPTYKNRPNGCRRDLAEKLEAMKPAFVRFPGGCYIEGDGWVNDNRRFEWKKTIGPVEERAGHYNYNWGYPCTDGMGFHEFLQLTEDLGAEPLFVVNVGIGHGWYTDYTQIDEYIQEALDAIEYCNGDVTTEWGARRAANGHPEPFNLRLIEIGNENYNFDDDRSDHYPERYKAFYDAIKARYPEVTLIGNVEAWGTDNPSWRNSFPCEIVDEHYYRSPSWFENCYNKYDSYDRSRPKVYVGEYAVTQEFGNRGHLRAALGEAVYMLGMERNSDIVIMNSYAPIFINEERGGGWVPDMIRFTHSQSYGTPSYWVQQLMPNNTGRRNLNWTEEGNLDGAGSRIALSSWSTKVRYDNVRVTTPDGAPVFEDDFSATETDAWQPASGWARSGGMLVQNNGSSQGTFYAGTVDLPSAYTLELDAVKDSGAEGFLIGFNYADADNYCWWNIGGWNNAQHGLQVSRNGSKSDFDLKAGTIAAGRTYKIRIDVDGTHVKCWLDGELIHDLILPVHRKVYVASSIDDDTRTMYLKIVNTSGEERSVDIALKNAGIDAAEVTVLTSSSDLDENSASDPLKVSPAEGSMQSVDGNKAVYMAPAYSLSIIRFTLNDINYSDDAGKTPTDAQIEAATAELRPVICKLGFLHASTSLPLTTSSGATVEWNLREPSDRLAMTISRFSATLDVTKANTGSSKIAAGTLVATVTFPDGARGDIEIPVTLAPADGMYGYLYTFMNPNYETTNYALATKDSYAKKFDVLLDGDEIFDTEALAPIEGGTRDAFMNRGERADEYFMVTTDMSNIKSGMWNNHGIDLLRSTDMIHWESTAFDFNKGKAIFSDPDATTDGYKTDAEYARITRVWAPQFIWDAEKDAYLVYYSILSSNPGDTHDRMFYSYADKDFKTLTQPRLFYDPGYAVIDADILYSEYDGLYHMMIKKEGASAAQTGIFEYTSPRLLGAPWTEVMHMRAEGDAAVEGPTHIRRIDEDIYNLYYMRYDSEYSYKVVDLDHMGTGYSSSFKLSGTGSFQHGSIMTVTEDEYNVLATWSEIMTTIKKYERLDPDALADAIAAARRAIDSNRNVATLAEALPPALEALKAAYDDDYEDITGRIVNPDFNANNGDGWSGTSFTATNAGVAEFWNKTFDKYQDLADMPAGKYRLEVQGFYRYGYQAESRAAHDNGTEQLLASYYMNAAENPFMSLYDTTLPTVPDNVGQSNTAFNVNSEYHNTPLYVELTERGTLRIGLKKTRAVNGDWCCFDNFRLFYKGSQSGVENVTVNNPDGPVNVYTVAGVLIREAVDPAEATSGLAPGIYIVNNRKVHVL